MFSGDSHIGQNALADGAVPRPRWGAVHGPQLHIYSAPQTPLAGLREGEGKGTRHAPAPLKLRPYGAIEIRLLLLLRRMQ